MRLLAVIQEMLKFILICIFFVVIFAVAGIVIFSEWQRKKVANRNLTARLRDPDRIEYYTEQNEDWKRFANIIGDFLEVPPECLRRDDSLSIIDDMGYDLWIDFCPFITEHYDDFPHRPKFTIDQIHSRRYCERKTCTIKPEGMELLRTTFPPVDMAKLGDPPNIRNLGQAVTLGALCDYIASGQRPIEAFKGHGIIRRVLRI